MAGAGGTTPLRLKDLLELDCESCSAAGFQCYPRRLLGESSSAPAMRRLLDSPPSLRRRPSKKLSHLSRSLSRRLLSKGGFFRRRQDEDDDEDGDACAAAAAPSGGGSESGASSSETTTTSDNSSGSRGSRCESDSDFSTATSSSTSDSMDAAAAAVNGITGDEHEAMKRSGSSSGSEQLSPVAVMDFPSDDDEGGDGDADGDRGVAGECSSSFSLARLQRRTMLRLQHKIRRFGCTEELVPVDLETLMAATSDSGWDDIVQELGPVVDLETLMAATSDSDTDDIADDVVAQQQVFQCRIGDAAAVAPLRPISRNHCDGAGVVHHETHEHGLLGLLMDAASACADHVSERLLFDFFVEMKRRRGSMEHYSGAERLLPREAERRLGDGEALAAARGWLDGAGSERWGLNDVLRGGEAIVAEMERPRRWMQGHEEEREIGAVVAGMLADQLVDEMVWDLLV